MERVVLARAVTRRVNGGGGGGVNIHVFGSARRISIGCLRPSWIRISII